MKIVISHAGIAREFETPFAICMDREQLEKLIHALKAAHGAMGDSTYGWQRVDDHSPTFHSGYIKKWNE